MNLRRQGCLLLLTVLLIQGQALAAGASFCDPVCCDEPCSAGADDCACCAQGGPVSDEPVVPAPPAPSALICPPPIVVLDRITATTAPVPVPPLPAPPPPRPLVLRI